MDVDAWVEENLQMIAALRRVGDSDFAVGVVGPIASGRCDADQQVIFHAEDLNAGVDLGNVVQAPRPQLKFQKALAIGAQRDFIIDAGRHVAEMRRRHVLAAHRLKVEHVDRLIGALDRILGIERGPVAGIRKPSHGCRDLARDRSPSAGRQQRAAGQELQEAASAGSLMRSRHNSLPRISVLLFVRCVRPDSIT